jgi:pimeloyl-ACP methyl ester carboxylesterase
MLFYKIIKKPFFGKFMVSWKNPLREEAKKEWTEIFVESKSGATLICLYAAAKSEVAKATIILAHPMGKEAKGYFIKHGYTDLLRENGYNVFVFDINGFGESGIGNFSFHEDIIAVSIKAKSITPDLPIGYHGISLGGQMATIAFTDIEHRYDFAIIESAATTLQEFWKQFPTAFYFLKFIYLFVPRYGEKISMIDRIKEVKKLQSILFIYSKTDTWVPFSMGERFNKNCNVQSSLWAVENAEHAQIMKSDYKQQYQKRILEYFEEAVR